MDSKTATFYETARAIKKKWPERKDHIWRILVATHIIYITRTKEAKSFVVDAKGNHGSEVHILISGTLDEILELVCSLHERNAARKAAKEAAVTTQRHQAAPYYITKAADDEGRGGNSPSLAGLESGDDEKRLSTIRALHANATRLANCTTVVEILQELKSVRPRSEGGGSRYPGAGGLCSQRVLT